MPQLIKIYSKCKVVVILNLNFEEGHTSLLAQ